jgi:hypothetical protein
MREIHHALVLNMHQPPRNLENLLETNEWEVKEILFAYDRMPRVVVGLSGHRPRPSVAVRDAAGNPVQPDFQQPGLRHGGLRQAALAPAKPELFEILGTGYYHPVLALTPEADWDEHIARWQAIARICCGDPSSTDSGRRKWVSTCG